MYSLIAAEVLYLHFYCNNILYTVLLTFCMISQYINLLIYQYINKILKIYNLILYADMVFYCVKNGCIHSSMKGNRTFWRNDARAGAGNIYNEPVVSCSVRKQRTKTRGNIKGM